MKALLISALAALAIQAASAQTGHHTGKPAAAPAAKTEKAVSPPGYTSVGKAITPKGAQPAGAVPAALATGKEASMKIKGKVHSVCQVKGCWMKLALPDGKLMHVTFANYSFFVPRDITGREVVIEGTASLDTMAVEDLRHYAEDAGKSEQDIAAITQPEVTYQFDAAGVLIPKK